MGEKGTILLADHHTRSLAAVSDTLQSAGFSVEATHCADGFFRAVRNSHHDLILVDQGLPDLDCLAACRKIMEYSWLRCSARPSVVFLSGTDGNQAPAFRGDPALVDGFIPRSRTGRELVATIESMILSRKTRLHTIMQDVPTTGEDCGCTAAVAQFHQLLESAPDAMVVADRTGRIILVNAGTEKLFGYDRSELLGQSTEILVPPEKRAAHRQIRRRFFENHGPGIPGDGFEFSCRRKDGTVFPAVVNLGPLDTERGLQFVSTIRDITRRRNVERSIQAKLNAQKVIGAILHLALEPISLGEFLQKTLEMILDLPWLSLLKKGAIFLVEGPPDILVMKAQVQLPDQLLHSCARVPFGHCLCGRAAAAHRAVFADHVDRRHETAYEGMPPHGHFCLPIMDEDRLFGVVNLYLRQGQKTDREGRDFLKMVTDALAGTIKRRQTEQELQNNQSQLLAAQTIQEHILPRTAPNFPGFEIAGAYKPAEFTAGDHYDHFLQEDGSLIFAIGDVSGHGFSSALLMASTHAYFHALTSMKLDLGQVFRRANVNLNRETDTGQFITAILGRIDPATRELTYVSAGHPTGYVFDPAGAVKARLTSTGVPLAVLSEGEYPQGEPVRLESGDIVVVLTDGVLEAMSPAQEFFGEERTLEVVRRHADLTAKEIIGALIGAVDEFRDRSQQDDDITAVVIKAMERP